MTTLPRQPRGLCWSRDAKGKAALFIKGLVQEKKDTWEHLVAELTEKYAASSAEDRARAFQKAMKLKQKSDEELRAYRYNRQSCTDGPGHRYNGTRRYRHHYIFMTQCLGL
jgi:hypothetical protein